MTRSLLLGCVVAFLLPTPARAAPSDLEIDATQALELPARRRRESAKGSGVWEAAGETLRWDPRRTAVVICDMWDQHWCKSAATRVAELAPRVNALVAKLRAAGVFVIHAPSSTLDFYKDTPQRRRAQSAKALEPPVAVKAWCPLDTSREAPLPVDDSDGGCDDEPRCPHSSPWRRQHPAIEIAAEDAITDSVEAYYLLEERGIENVLLLGVHTNICVLGRPFAIRQMVNLRKNVALVRDLTDTMYNPRRRPFVDHFRGTDLVVEHVEKYWCPTVTSAAILGGEPFRFGADRRPHLVFVIGEDEYDTKTTLPEFARSELETLGMRCTFVHAAAGDPNDFPGLEALAAADLVAVSVRRRTPRRDQLELLRRHVDAHKPVVGIRTASHAFDRAVPDAEHASWPGFDAEVLGGSYQGHFGNKPPSGPATWVRALPDAATHPILAAWPAEEIAVTSHLYKNPRLGPKVTPLLAGRLDGKDVTEPVAWINTADDRRVFYTSLGNPGDFRLPAFRSLLRSGFLWCLGMTAKR